MKLCTSAACPLRHCPLVLHPARRLVWVRAHTLLELESSFTSSPA
jgi:hypothetical protein